MFWPFFHVCFQLIFGWSKSVDAQSMIKPHFFHITQLHLHPPTHTPPHTHLVHIPTTWYTYPPSTWYTCPPWSSALIPNHSSKTIPVLASLAGTLFHSCICCKPWIPADSLTLTQPIATSSTKCTKLFGSWTISATFASEKCPISQHYHHLYQRLQCSVISGTGDDMMYCI